MWRRVLPHRACVGAVAIGDPAKAYVGSVMMRGVAIVRQGGRRGLLMLLATMLVLAGLLIPGVGGDRVALAAGCVVTNTNDAGAGSLRAALGNTDGFANCDAITFGAGVTGTITLQSNLPAVTRTVVVTGPGAAKLTINRDTFNGTIFTVGVGGDLTLTGLTLFKANIAVALASGGRATVTESTFDQINNALRFTGGGTATVTGSTITGAQYGLYFSGGGAATVTSSTFVQNGPGLYFAGGGTATVANSTFSNHESGLYFDQGGTATVTGSTFVNNGPVLDFAGGGTATVANSTFDSNRVGLRFADGGTATVTNSTLRGNETGLEFSNGGAATLANTLLMKGGKPNCPSGGVTNATSNLADDATCFADGSAGGTSTVAAAGLGLDPAGLADNGGATRTVALLPGSPAVNAGDAAACAAAPVGGVDQRGVARPQGARCDVGAYELAPVPTTLAVAPTGGTYGGETTLAATLAQPGPASVVTGRVVAFALDGAPVCDNAAGGYPAPCPATDAWGVATLAVTLGTRPAGTYPGVVGARFAGDATYAASGASGPLTVTRATQTIAFPSPPDHAYGDPPFTVDATASSGLPVRFTAGPAGVCAASGVDGGTIALTGPGACTVVAHQAGDANFLPAPDVARTLGVPLTVTVRGPGDVSPASGFYVPGTPVTLQASPAAGGIFLGWAVDGRPRGWAAALTVTMDGPHSVVATFAPRPGFTDVSPGDPAYVAATQLAARGIVKGYGDGRYGPGDPVLRAQFAAMLVRAFDWSGEDHGASAFADLGELDPELRRAVGTLAFHGVLRGYGDGTYRPTEPLLHIQAVLAVSRGLVAVGLWAPATADDPAIYPNLVGLTPADRLDLVAFVHNAGAIPDRPSGQAWADWDRPATRGWAARLLWQALDRASGPAPAP